MKKDKLLIGVGIILITLGVVLFNLQNKKQDTIIYIEEDDTLTEDEVKRLIEEKVSNVINIYEDKNKTFKLDAASDKDGYVKVNNYSETINKTFTENGIRELENTKFNGKNFFVKEDDNIYLLDEIPADNKYINSNITLDKIDSSDKEITCLVTLSTYRLNDKEVLTFYIIEKKLKLIKSEENWLVDTFNYANE